MEVTSALSGVNPCPLRWVAQRSAAAALSCLPRRTRGDGGMEKYQAQAAGDPSLLPPQAPLWEAGLRMVQKPHARIQTYDCFVLLWLTSERCDHKTSGLSAFWFPSQETPKSLGHMLGTK